MESPLSSKSSSETVFVDVTLRIPRSEHAILTQLMTVFGQDSSEMATDAIRHAIAHQIDRSIYQRPMGDGEASLLRALTMDFTESNKVSHAIREICAATRLTITEVEALTRGVGACLSAQADALEAASQEDIERAADLEDTSDSEAETPKITHNQPQSTLPF
ncbi:MAG: hypothetical protein SFV32_07145 [Opitutaceae bacterium]|nr:hypothetical protein [Opitutaceae bacterium]